MINFIKKIMKLDLVSIFTIAVLASIVCTFVYNYFVNGAYLRNEYRTFHFIEDHARHIIGLVDKTNYPDFWMVFPPFAYLIYDFFLKSDTTILTNMSYENLSYDTYHIYYVFAILQLVLIALIIFEIFKNFNFVKRTCFAIAIVFSYPVYYITLYQGNNILTATLLLLSAMILLYDRFDYGKNKKCKILAMILIAFAFGLKIVPAIFGLEFIRKKDYKSAIILAIFGLIVFFLPFLYFDGVNTLKKYIEVLTNQEVTEEIPATSIYYYIHFIFLKLFNIDIYEKNIVVKLFQILFLFINIFLYFKTNKHWQRMALLGFICYAFIPRSFAYYILYMLISLIFFFIEENKTIDKINNNFVWIYVIIYTLLFSVYLFHYTEGVHFMWMVVLMVVMYFDILLYNLVFGNVKIK